MLCKTPLVSAHVPASHGGSLMILGSTGSIGTQTLQVLERFAHGYTVDTLVAGRNVALLAQQARQWQAKRVVVAQESCYAALKETLFGTGITITAGANAVLEAAHMPHACTMAAMSGRAGVAPTMAALQHSQVVCLANKETLIYQGEVIAAQRDVFRALIIPVDSEHASLYALYRFDCPAHNAKMILTASGGPFLNTPLDQLPFVTPEQACAHPKWTMGKKISVDSSLMLNKVLEIIEAYMLFGHTPDCYDIVVHPQAMVHAMIQSNDGSIRAHFCPPTMHAPIAAALALPHVWGDVVPTSLTALNNLTFLPPDAERFSVLKLLPTLLHCPPEQRIAFFDAAEHAVEQFLAQQCRFTDIIPLALQNSGGFTHG